MNSDYKQDLTAANEHHEPCAYHPDERAIACDLDAWGRKVPICFACWEEHRERILARLFGRALVVGGIKG